MANPPNWWAVLIWVLIITILSLKPSTGGGGLFPHADKVGHFGVYAIFSILLYSKLNSLFPLQKATIITLAVCIIYGILMEVLQATLTTTRHFDTTDMLANTVGAIIGVIIIYFFNSKFYQSWI